MLMFVLHKHLSKVVKNKRNKKMIVNCTTMNKVIFLLTLLFFRLFPSHAYLQFIEIKIREEMYSAVLFVHELKL